MQKVKNTLLITGSSGMVGKNIALHKKARLYNVLSPTSKELDLLSQEKISAYLKEYKPDIIIHCAGLVGGIMANIKNPTAFLSQNAYMGLNLLNAAHKEGIKKVLNLASSCMYPRNASNPLKEELILSGELEPTNEGYALAKILCVRLCEYISQDTNFLYKSIIPCNLYGKFDKFDSLNAHLIPAIIAKVHLAKIKGLKELEIWGDGSARREFMYAEDLADFVFEALERFEDLPQNLNVGLGKDYTINEYYEAVAKVLGFKGKFKHDLSKPSGMKQKLIDDTRLKAFGFKAKTSLEEGIAKTYEYYLKGEKQMQGYALASSTWDEKELKVIQEVIDSDIFTMGKKVAEFEKEFAKFVGSKYAVMTSSGSTANLIATAALFYTKKPRLQRGDEVIVPAVSWSTTYYPLYQYGLKLKFVDIDLYTLNYDLEALKEAISAKTKMIVCVNLLGNPNDFDAIKELIKGKDIILFEDNCESMGAEYKGKQAGSFGLMGTFSTFYSHHMATMEGGFVVSDDEELYHILLSLRAHGWTRNLPKHNLVSGTKSDDYFEEAFKFVLPGYNVRPVEMSGAIGIEQLKKLPLFLKNRRENASYFVELFKDSKDFIIQQEIGLSSWFGFSFIIKPQSKITRKEVIKAFKEANIEVRPIVTGDFTQNEVIKYFDYELFGELKNAKLLHTNGFFVGNHQINIKAQIDLLYKTLNTLSQNASNGGGALRHKLLSPANNLSFEKGLLHA